MTATLLTPDVRRIIAELERRLGVLERRINPVAAVATGSETHDGTGAGSTIANLSADSPVASGVNSTAIGRNAHATNDRTVALGGAANGTSAPLASGEAAIAIGATEGTSTTGPIAEGEFSIAIGSANLGVSGPYALGDNSIAFGQAANAWGENSVAVGYASGGMAESSVAIGFAAAADHQNSVAVGTAVGTSMTDQFTIGTKRLFAGCPTTAPADATLVNGQVTIWVDQTGNTLTFKVKYSSGTVKSGTVALT